MTHFKMYRYMQQSCIVYCITMPKSTIYHTMSVPAIFYPIEIKPMNGKNIIIGMYSIDRCGQDYIIDSTYERTAMDRIISCNDVDNMCIDIDIEGKIFMDGNTKLNVHKSNVTTIADYMLKHVNFFEIKLRGTMILDLSLSIKNHDSNHPTLDSIVCTRYEYDTMGENLNLI